MNEYRSIGGKEFKITPQVLYDIAFMSFPEFRDYYSLHLSLQPTPELDLEFYELWENLKLDVIKNGVDRSLRLSSLTKLKTKCEAKKPKVKKGRGRPKK
jgi:hypothetical protein